MAEWQFLAGAVLSYPSYSRDPDLVAFAFSGGRTVNGVALCRMFNRALRGHRSMPKHLSSDHDPLHRFHQCQANLRILEVTEVKTVPDVPLSHPFVERLIGTLRHEYLDRTLFWTTVDLENKLLEFRDYFNNERTHHSLEGRTPDPDRTGHHRSLISTSTDGNLTVEACIRHPSLPDSRTILRPRYPGSIWQGYTSANCSLFEFIGVARSADRIASLPSSALTMCGSPHIHSAMSPRTGHRINSPDTGSELA